MIQGTPAFAGVTRKGWRFVVAGLERLTTCRRAADTHCGRASGILSRSRRPHGCDAGGAQAAGLSAMAMSAAVGAPRRAGPARARDAWPGAAGLEARPRWRRGGG